MESASRKRAATSEVDHPAGKRLRTAASYTAFPIDMDESSDSASTTVTADELAKSGLRRSIGLVLDKVGFDSADPLAMETFTELAEAYMTSMFEHVQALASAARRSHANPVDFENTIKYFNLTTSALKPHLKPPVPKAKREPEWTDLVLKRTNDLVIPILDEELSGTEEKTAKTFIPESFPSFPSIHTYKYTPQDVASVTVSNDWGIFHPDKQSQSILDSQPSQPEPKSQKPTRPLEPEEIPRGDPKKLREAAAKEARLGEEALRRLMRASKIAKQKEVWSSAQLVPNRKNRYNLWEGAMREAIEDESSRTKGKARDAGGLPSHGAMGRFEIADHSMIVNTERKRARLEMTRPGARRPAGESLLGR
ncbi:hypothetical protein GQ53DRAFT_655334 [Thozetella sp. PMI_491]|nr:hypothetical protein GQ53DRAFT_655334 [Thozetella sp. PMI_491]